VATADRVLPRTVQVQFESPTEDTAAPSAWPPVLESREAERRRISRELHDRIGQAMVAIRLLLTAARKEAGTDHSGDLILEGIAIVDRALIDVRRLSSDLRSNPPPDVGLIAAIASCLEYQSRLASYHAEFTTDPLDRSLPAALEADCYSVVREALTNVARHADARNVSVGLRLEPAWIVVTVIDDGVGFEPRPGVGRYRRQGLGLVGMAERTALHGGSLEVTARPGHGTTVSASFARPHDGPGAAP